jgi:ADYC domain
MDLLRHALASAAILLPVAASACALEDGAEPSPFGVHADTLRPCIGCNWGPPLLNSHGLNGISVAALDTHGLTYGGWRLSEVAAVGDLGIADRVLHDVHAEDGVLFGLDARDTPVSGAGFVGSRWVVEMEATAEKEVMEIVDFVADPASSRYTFLASAGPTVPDAKFYTCPKDDETGEFSAVVFADIDVDANTGTHFERPNTMYFACVSAAVGKAAMWGYSPWATDADTHQTASRMVRADYCGVGRPYTKAGTPLQIEDVIGIHRFSDPGRDTEALWGPQGAECIKVPRFVDASEVSCAGVDVPFCAAQDAFGDWKGALLWSKLAQ